MIAFIKGKIQRSEDNLIIIESSGVGFELIASTTTVSVLSGTTGETTVYTYMQVREDAITLFGFYDIQEKNMFQKLITVSGIGPKLAITVLSGISPSELAIAILTGDMSVLLSVKGLGKKTAERIVVELREKVGRLEDVGKDILSKSTSIAINRNIEDAAFALTALGINKNEAVRLVSRVATSDMTAEEIIKKTLREMGK